MVPAGWSQVASDIIAQKYFRRAGIPAALVPVAENDVPDFLWRKAAATAELKELPEEALGFPSPIESVMLKVEAIGTGIGGTKFFPIGPECLPVGDALSPGLSELLLFLSATGLPLILTKSLSSSVILPA